MFLYILSLVASRHACDLQYVQQPTEHEICDCQSLSIVLLLELRTLMEHFENGEGQKILRKLPTDRNQIQHSSLLI